MEKLLPETNSTQPKKVRFIGKVGFGSDPATEVKEMPFPTRRVLHWLPQFRSPDGDAPPPVAILISQEVLVAVNNHVSQSLATELGGFLLGNRYCDPANGQEFVIVDQYVEAQYTESTSVSLAFTTDAWMRLKEDLSGKFIGKALIGWYHSHPRMDVFLSPFDLHVHEERFKEPWNVALVIEPEKQLGGFFVWRDGKINPRHPVEFYEYLSADMVKTKESRLTWVNYICLDEPQRLQPAPDAALISRPDVIAHGSGKVALGSLSSRIPENLQRLIFMLILGAVMLISASLTYYFINREPNGPAQPPGETRPSAKKLAYSILDKTDTNDVKFRWHMERKRITERVGRRARTRDVYEPTARAEITLIAKDLPEDGRDAKQLLDENIDQVQVSRRDAKKEYIPQIGKLNIRLTVYMPVLLSQMKQPSPSGALEPVKIEFFARGDNNPIEMNGEIHLEDIPRALRGESINISMNIPPLPPDERDFPNPPPPGPGGQKIPDKPLIPPTPLPVSGNSNKPAESGIKEPQAPGQKQDTSVPATATEVEPNRLNSGGDKSQPNESKPAASPTPPKDVKPKSPKLDKEGNEPQPPAKDSSDKGASEAGRRGRNDTAARKEEDRKKKEEDEKKRKEAEKKKREEAGKNGSGGGVLNKIKDVGGKVIDKLTGKEDKKGENKKKY
jgi:proteasome lid subunit RPN8/RPN11